MGGCVSTGKECKNIDETMRRIAPLHLPSLSNRIFTNGKNGDSCIFTQQGCKGINQDAMIAWDDFILGDGTFCGVFDGHGPYGHFVARKVRDSLPVKLLSFLQSGPLRRKDSSRNCGGGSFRKMGDRKDKDATSKEMMNSLWREAFLKSYKAMDKELRAHPSLDCFCSGSTAVTILRQGPNLYIGYVGDSRAVLGSKDGSGSITATQLTVDMKPDLPREAERIRKCNGRVFAMRDEPEVPRVWLPHDDAPGLAMARAFGDFCLKDYGVISQPEFSHRVLTENDQFIILASDGVWDVLSNEEVVEIVATAPKRSAAARIIVESAAYKWKVKYPTSKMDDCAVVCLYLDGQMDAALDNEARKFTSAARNIKEFDDIGKSEPSLQGNSTARSSEETTGVRGRPRFLDDDQQWLGLEGVTRVNSLVQLPRFQQESADS